MDELYEYMNIKMLAMYAAPDSSRVSIDKEHFLRLRQMLCYMMQIRLVVNQDELVGKLMEEVRNGRAENQ